MSDDYEKWLAERTCARHKKFNSRERAEKARREMQKRHGRLTTVYTCPVCLKLHVATVKKGVSFYQK